MSKRKEILQELIAERSSLSALPKITMPNDVPVGYFEKLPELLGSQALTGKEQIDTLKNGNVPTIDFPYHDEKHQEGRLQKNGHCGEKFAVKNHRIKTRIWAWAAACLLLFGMGYGSVKYFQPFRAPETIAYSKLDKINLNELELYAENHFYEIGTSNAPSVFQLPESKLNAALSQVDINEIQSYLSRTGELNTIVTN